MTPDESEQLKRIRDLTRLLDEPGSGRWFVLYRKTLFVLPVR